MRRSILLFTLCLAPLALAAKPTFQSVVKKFPPATLPYTLEKREKPQLTLEPAEAAALGIYRDTSGPLEALRGSKQTPDGVLDSGLHPIASIQRGGNLLLLLAFDFDFDHGMARERQTFLLSYGDRGALLGGVLFHRVRWSSAWGQETNVSTLDQAGAVTRRITGFHLGYGDGVEEQLEVAGEARASVTSTGAIKVAATEWKSRKGRYVDRKSKEELIVDDAILYQAGPLKPLQELQVEGDHTVRFKGSPRPYVLTWNERNDELRCRNPDGTVQVFTREW